MGALQRLDWIEQQILSGSNVQLSMSLNAASSVEKVKFTISQAAVPGTSHSASMFSVVTSIRNRVRSSVVTDRGHYSHSARRSVVEFWIRAVNSSTDVAGSVASGAPDLPPVPPPSLPAVSLGHAMLDSLPFINDSIQNIESQLQSIHTIVSTMYDQQYDSVAPLQELCEHQNSTITSLWAQLHENRSVATKLEDNMSILAQIRKDVNVLQGGFALSSNNNFEQVSVVGTSSENEDEKWVPLDETTKLSSRFWDKRIFDSGLRRRGSVVNLARCAKSGEVMYQVKYDAGGLRYVTRDEVKAMVAADAERKAPSKPSSSARA